jgi:hypothetical protein
MGHIGKGPPQHHCPGQHGKVDDDLHGNCRRHWKDNYCSQHQTVCPVHTNWAHMKNQPCELCERAEEAKLK